MGGSSSAAGAVTPARFPRVCHALARCPQVLLPGRGGHVHGRGPAPGRGLALPPATERAVLRGHGEAVHLRDGTGPRLPAQSAHHPQVCAQGVTCGRLCSSGTWTGSCTVCPAPGLQSCPQVWLPSPSAPGSKPAPRLCTCCPWGWLPCKQPQVGWERGPLQLVCPAAGSCPATTEQRPLLIGHAPGGLNSC